MSTSSATYKAIPYQGFITLITITSLAWEADDHITVIALSYDHITVTALLRDHVTYSMVM